MNTDLIINIITSMYVVMYCLAIALFYVVVFRMKKYAFGVKVFDWLIAQNGTSSELYEIRGRLHHFLKHNELASQDYNNALRWNPKAYRSRTQLGMLALGQAEYQQALHHFQQVVTLKPKLASGYGCSGIVYNQLKEYQRALQCLNQALLLAPKAAPIYRVRGNTYAGLCDYLHAIEDYSQALRYKPRDAVAYRERAKAYKALNDYEHAVQDYQQVLTLLPDSYSDHLSLAALLFKHKDYQDALPYYQRAAELKPKSSLALNSCGAIYYELKNYSLALETLNLALALEPKYAWAYRYRGCIYVVQHQHQLAVHDFSSALKLDTTSTLTYQLRAVSYMKLRKYAQAIEDDSAALVLKPTLTTALLNRSNAYFHLKAYQKALHDCDTLIALEPENLSAYVTRSAVLCGLGRFEQAQQDCQRVLTVSPNHDIALHNLAYITAASGDISKARGYALKGCDQKPKSPEHGCLLAWLKMCQERPDAKTVNYLIALAAFTPHADASYICRGIAYWLQEQYEEALQELEQLIVLDPLIEDVYFWVGMVCASYHRDQEAIDALQHALKLGLLPQLLAPLVWLKDTRPDFYDTYVSSLLTMNNPDAPSVVQ